MLKLVQGLEENRQSEKVGGNLSEGVGVQKGREAVENFHWHKLRTVVNSCTMLVGVPYKCAK